MAELSSSDSTLSRTAFELKRFLALGAPVCCVCTFVSGAIKRYIDQMYYEHVNDGSNRDAIRRAGGFCRYHTQMVANQADALGSSLILEDVVNNAIREIEHGKYRLATASSNPLTNFLGGIHGEPERSLCPICATEHEMDELAVDSLCQSIGHSDFRDLLDRSAGLCVPHFHLAARRCGDMDIWGVILEIELKALANLASRLRELAASCDYQSTVEATPEQTQSTREALNITSSWVDLCSR